MSAPTWSLDTLFEGGATGAPVRAELEQVEQAVGELSERAAALPPLPEGVDAWAAMLNARDATQRRLGQLGCFASCLTSADTTDREARRMQARILALWAQMSNTLAGPRQTLAKGTDAEFRTLYDHPDLADAQPWMLHVRKTAALRLTQAEEELRELLAPDGISAWGRAYQRISGQVQVELADGSRVAATQAQNLLSSPDAAVREDALAAYGRAWEGVEEECAEALTHIVGTRLTLNRRRGVGPLADTLAANRMTQATLDALMEAATRAQPLLERYLNAKAKAMGKSQMDWSDLAAPVPGAASSTMSFDDAQDFILEHFGGYHADLQSFAARAFNQRWIEAEDRNNKRPGGWCASAPITGESRIFMTFGDSFRNTVTLAHELGHAYHNWVAKDLPLPRRMIPSTLAETASVFAESLVRDAALKAATEPSARLAMLDQRLMSGVAFLMNIPARYAFERALYPLREKGELDPAELTATMVECQQAAYGGALNSCFGHFWASKLHFFLSGRAFYNYPYTFGYLFAQLVYAKVLAEGPSYHPKYVELLQRTGWEEAEPLALDVLGLDLEDPDTWWAGIQPLETDLAGFLEIVEGS